MQKKGGSKKKKAKGSDDDSDDEKPKKKKKAAGGKLFLDQPTSVADPNPDPHVFGPPGSGSISQNYGSGSFYHQAEIVRKTLIPTAL
jgi:hypothetical protein